MNCYFAFGADSQQSSFQRQLISGTFFFITAPFLSTFKILLSVNSQNSPSLFMPSIALSLSCKIFQWDSLKWRGHVTFVVIAAPPPGSCFSCCRLWEWERWGCCWESVCGGRLVWAALGSTHTSRRSVFSSPSDSNPPWASRWEGKVNLRSSLPPEDLPWTRSRRRRDFGDSVKFCFGPLAVRCCGTRGWRGVTQVCVGTGETKWWLR